MPSLNVTNGPLKGKSHEVKDEVITLGRDPQATIRILDQGVSRNHAEVFKIGEMCFIRDLGSTNGTFVNSQKITEELLRQGDQVQIGNTILAFEEPGAVARSEIFEETPAAGEAEEPDFGRQATTIEIPLDKQRVRRQGDSTESAETGGAKLSLMSEAIRIFTRARDTKTLLNEMLRAAMDVTGADAGYVFLRDRKSGKIVPEATAQKPMSGVKVSRTIVRRVLQIPRAVLTSDAMLDDRFSGSASVVMENIRSVICAPLLVMDSPIGVLYLHRSGMERVFRAGDLEMATTLALQMGMALTALEAGARVRSTLLSVTRTLVSAIEHKDPQSQGHSDRVATYAMAIARQMGMSETEVEKAQLAALLHDVGKIVAPLPELPVDRVRGLPQHVKEVEKLLGPISDVEDLLPAIKYHHEKLNGSGILGLTSERIPKLARILCIANDLDNLLTHGGPKGEGLAVKDVLLDMGKRGGVEYDQEVVHALLICHRKGILFPSSAKASA